MICLSVCLPTCTCLSVNLALSVRLLSVSLTSSTTDPQLKAFIVLSVDDTSHVVWSKKMLRKPAFHHQHHRRLLLLLFIFSILLPITLYYHQRHHSHLCRHRTLIWWPLTGVNTNIFGTERKVRQHLWTRLKQIDERGWLYYARKSKPESSDVVSRRYINVHARAREDGHTPLSLGLLALNITWSHISKYL